MRNSRSQPTRARRSPVVRPPAAVAALVVALACLLGAAAAPAAAAPGGDPLATLAVQQAKLTAGDAAASDYLGYSVAIDGETALVGAPSADSGVLEAAGAAYVFTRSGVTWTQQAKLIADAPVEYGRFGASVALDGDTALIGMGSGGIKASPEPGFVAVGAAYVFTRSGATWTQQAKLSGGDTVDAYGFGASVALDGDTALIGASLAESGGEVYAGAAYVFTRSGATWTQQARLTAGVPVEFGRFGAAVALDGDSALISARTLRVFGSSGFVLNDGAVYVFTRSGATWTQQAELTPDATVEWEWFGVSLALDGDTALVGSYGITSTSVSDVDIPLGTGGAAYVFTRSGTTWTQQAKLTAADATFDDAFGVSVALQGDTALIGAEHFQAAGVSGPPQPVASPGAAYIFTRSGTTWTQYQKLAASGEVAGDGFGHAVALDADSFLMGAPLAASGELAQAGAAYVFMAPSMPSSTVQGRTKGWQKRPVKLTFAGQPGPYGIAVAYTEYRLGDGEWVRGSAVTIRRQGVTRVEYRAVDIHANVQEPPGHCAVRVDTRRPRVQLRSGPAGPAGSAAWLKYRVRDHVPGCGRALVRLVVVDASGRALTRSSTRQVKTNAWHKLRISTRSLSPGTYVVVVRAMDLARNFQRGVTRTTLTVN